MTPSSRETDSRVTFALAVYGLSTMAGQILLLRELVAILYGNELSVGVLLGVWLVLTAVGSGLLGRVFARGQRPTRALALSQLLFAVLLPVAIAAVRMARGLLFPDLLPGELVGLAPMLLASLLLLAPVCVLSGGQFAVGCQAHGAAPGATAAAVGRAYAAVAFGDILAGALLSSYWVMRLDPFWLAYAVLVANVASAVLLSGRRSRAVLAAAAVAAVALVAAARWPGALAQYAAQRQWAGFDLVASGNSVYGTIAVTRQDELLSFYQNGRRAFSTPDTYAAEETVHLPMLAHPDPERVLVIGGGIGGGLEALIEHRPEALDYVELDPELLRMAEIHGSAADRQVLRDPRVTLSVGDGRWYVKQGRSAYDAILVNVPDPATVQLNRFYSLEFFQEAQRALREGGLLAIQISSSAAFLDARSLEVNGCVYRTLAEVFRHVHLLPGEALTLLATDRDAGIAASREEYVGRLEERGIEARFVTKYYLLATERLDEARTSELRRSLDGTSSLRLNTDFQPVGCFYQMGAWNFMLSDKGQGSWLAGALRRMGEADLRPWLLVAAVWAGLAALLARARPGAARPLTALSMALVGFGGLVLEVGLVFAFQALYGYVYQKIGLIVAAFMVGSIVGSLWMSRRVGRIKRKARGLGLVALLGAAASLLVAASLPLLQRLTGVAADVAAQTVIPLLTGIIGVIVGMQFPLGSALLLPDDDSSEAAARAGGVAYASDLFGAAAGALVTTVVLLPAAGIVGTCLAAGVAFCLAAAPLLAVGKTAA